MGGACPRCGAERGDGRWCATCGLDSRPTAATLPTAEAMDAGNRERAWFSSHPDRAREEAEIREAAIARTKKAEYDRLANARPAGLITFCAYLFSAAFFAAWTYRAYKNITALGAR